MTCIKIHSDESPDCTNRFDTMTKAYDCDKIKYVCENCGLTGDPLWNFLRGSVMNNQIRQRFPLFISYIGVNA